LSLPAQTAPASSSSAPVTSTTATDSTQSVDSSTSSKSDVQQALHSFMHSLFQALKSQGENRRPEGSQDGERENEGSGGEVRQGRENYRSDLASRVQNLVQNLSGTGTTEGSPSSKIENLKTAFNNLVQALQQSSSTNSGTASSTTTTSTSTTGTTDTTTPAKAPDLQAFLQSFLKNLQGGSTPVSPLGGTVNTTV
jgi:hypothetical protein